MTLASPLTSSGGTLTKLGAGTLTLTGDNTYTGDTTISAGVLALGSPNAVGTSGTISFEGGTLQYSESNTTDYSSRFSTAASQSSKIDTNGQNVTLASPLTSSGGTLTKLGTGTLTLDGANTYSGDTTISAGALSVGSGSTSGSIAGNVTNHGTLLFDRSDASTYSGIISGSGAVTKLGADTLTLDGHNTYTGETRSATGTLALGSVNGLAGSTLDMNTADSGVVDFTVAGIQTYNLGGLTGSRSLEIGGNTLSVGGNGQSTTYAGSLSGTGALHKAGAGTLTLTGNNSYTGGTTISGGLLGLGSADAVGTSGPISFEGGTLQYSESNTTDYSSRFSTAASQLYAIDTNGQNVTLASALTSNGGTLTKLGTGTLTLAGDNTYAGGTTISGGTLALRSADALGASGTINLSAGGTLQIGVGTTNGVLDVTTLKNNGTPSFNGSDDSTYSGIISGDGALAKLGAGTLTLDGDNTYSGGTTISEGTLAVGSGATTGSIAGNVTNNGTLSFNRSNASTFSGMISGTGAVTKLGAGTLTLDGTNTYSGGTTITGGVLTLGSADALGASGTIGFGGGTLQYSAVNTTDYSSRFSTAPSQSSKIDTNGQNVTLASALTSSGGTLTKTGAGILTLDPAAKLTALGGLTASGGTTLINGQLGTGSSVASATNGGHLAFGTTSQTLASLNIGAGSTVSFSSGAASAFGAPGFKSTDIVPEPGTIGLLLVGTLGVLARRRRVPSRLTLP